MRNRSSRVCHQVMKHFKLLRGEVCTFAILFHQMPIGIQ